MQEHQFAQSCFETFSSAMGNRADTSHQRVESCQLYAACRWMRCPSLAENPKTRTISVMPCSCNSRINLLPGICFNSSLQNPIRLFAIALWSSNTWSRERPSDLSVIGVCSLCAISFRNRYVSASSAFVSWKRRTTSSFGKFLSAHPAHHAEVTPPENPTMTLRAGNFLLLALPLLGRF